MKNLTVIIVLTFLGINTIFSQAWIENLTEKEHANFYSIQKSFNEFWKDKEVKKGMGWKQFKRWEHFWEQRLYPDGEFPKAMDLYLSYKKEYDKLTPEDLQEVKAEWTILGPEILPVNRLQYKSSGMGRINVVRVHPVDDNILYAGASTGGLWISTDRGKTWNVSPFTDVMSIGISDIAIAPSNPSTIYIATGDKNGAFQSRAFSIGILKSTNGGNSWSFTKAFTQISAQTLFARILVNKTNPNIIYSGTTSGFYISNDGGENWEKKADGYFRELEFHPTNPNIIYGVVSGTASYSSTSAQIMVSKDGGNSWVSKLTLSNISRIELSTSPAEPNNLYALCAMRNSGRFGGYYVSNDMGDNWSLKSSSPNILGIDANSNDYSQGFYDLAHVVHPVYPNQIFIGGIHIFYSSDFGVTWNQINHWTGSGRPYVHADQHELVFNEKTFELYSVNDGGIYRSSTNGASWEDLSNGISIAQFYGISSSNTENGMIIGGTQDNGTHILMDGQWQHILGGDGMQCKIDPTDSKYIYASTQYGEIYRSSDRANNFSRIASYSFYSGEIPDWVTPYTLNPKKPSTIYVGYRNVFKSTNRGANWQKISSFSHNTALKTLTVAENDTNTIYASTGSTLYVTNNGGGSWGIHYQAKNIITDVVVDDNDPNRIWITTSGYTNNSKIFELFNGEVKNISYNLPNVPANTVVKLKKSISTLFVGTDVGVYYKDDFTNKWLPFNGNMPNVITADLEINYSTGKIYAGTYGRGLWEAVVFDCDIPKPKIKITGNLQFCAGDSVVLENEENYVEYKWSSGESSKKITIKTSGIYFLSIKDKNGCIQTSEPITVVVNSVPALKISAANNGVICKGDSLQLTASFGFKNYYWSTGDSTRSIKTTNPGKYFVYGITEKDCISKIDTIIVSESEKPNKPMIYQKLNSLITDSAYAYQWFFNNAPVSSWKTREIELKDNGKYKVEIYNEANCSAISEEFDIVVSVDGQNADNSEFSVYPNPSKDIFTIKLNKNIFNLKYNVKDLNGRILFENTLQSVSEFNINLADFAKGIYLLEIIEENQNYKLTLIKE